MKKFTFVFACAIILALNTKADNYHPIDIDKLPERAQTFLSAHFPESKISLSLKERDLNEISYDIIFTDGCKIEFNRYGEWTEIDCINHPVPTNVVPTAISNMVKEKYPNTTITKIERNKRETEIDLNNKVELTFNKKYQLIDID